MLKSLMTFIYWEWHLIPKWLLRNTFTQSPEQLLKNLVSSGSPGKYYSMIDCFLEDALVVLYCLFWNTVLQCNAQLQIHTLNYWTVQSVVPIFNWRCVWLVWHCTSLSCGSIMYAVQNLVYPNAPSLWYSICAIYASVGYMQWFGHISV